MTTSPSARNAATASRTTVRLTPVAAISSCSVGRREPGGILPPVMSAVSRATSSWASDRDGDSGAMTDNFSAAGLLSALDTPRTSVII